MATWYTANIATQGGSCEYAVLYYYQHSTSTVSSADGFYSEQNASSAYRVNNLAYNGAWPHKDGCTFLGGFANADGTGTRYASANGGLANITPSQLPSSTTFYIYLCWEGPSSATLSKTNLSGGPSAIFYDPSTDALYSDSSLTNVLPETTVSHGGQVVAAYGPIALPTKECYRFDGFFSSSNNSGTQYVTADGYVLTALKSKLASMTANDSLTIYAKGVKVSSKVALSPNGGTGGLAAVYKSTADSQWYADSLCAGDPITSVPIPGKITSGNDGYVFNGYGTFIDASGNIGTTSSTSVSAKWLSTTKMTVDANGGTGGDAFFYWCSSRSAYFHAVDGVLTQTAAIVPPSRPGYAFDGLYTASTGGTRKVSADGTIASGLTSATTLYAQWTQTAYSVTFSGATLPPFYVKASGGGLYRDADCEDPVGSGDALWDAPPALDGHVFLGVFASDSSSSTRYVTAAGTATADFVAMTATGEVTVYCLFDVLQPVTFDDAGGTGGPAALWYLDHALYADSRGETAATWPIPVPSRACFSFDGYFDGTGDTQHVGTDGAMTQAFSDLVSAGISEPLELSAQWTRLTWRVTLADAGGSGGIGVAYSLAGGETGWTSDPEGTVPITSVPVPEREGYVFLGYFTSASVQVVDTDGNVTSFVGGTGDVELSARWQARTFTLSFTDGSTPKTVTWGFPVGTLPTPTVPSGLTFTGWMVDGISIDAATVWAWTEDRIAAPRFVVPASAGFNEVVDWFGLASSALVPVSSDSGDERQRVCVAHMGKYSRDYGNANKDPVAVSGTWRNPSVTYMVVRDMALRVTLGKAYAATFSGGAMTVSGYMIASVRVSTGMKSFPTVTVSATANEGADAVNQFAVSVAIAARARPQNLLNSVSAGAAHLQSLELSASCQPVVVAENMMPCASDVVNGVMDVDAETLAPAATAAPTAGGGFTEVGVEQVGSSGDYRRWKIKARKEMA